MLADVGQGLLDDAIRREVETGTVHAARQQGGERGAIGRLVYLGHEGLGGGDAIGHRARRHHGRHQPGGQAGEPPVQRPVVAGERALVIDKVFRPDLEHPTRADAEPAFVYFQAMPIPYIEPEDMADLVLFLASDESKYITGAALPIDAGAVAKF